MSQASFALRGRNPDILTCIANLSNDEVFTTPELANEMLDDLTEAWAESNNGSEIWADSSVRFIDPFTKSGVFLREIVARLIQGLSGEIPDLQTRVDHILTKQVFGIGITELTSQLARRTLYCSKIANGKHSIAKSFTTETGNIWFGRTQHAWVGGKNSVLAADVDGNPITITTDGKCRFCGASQQVFDRGPELETYAYAFIHADDVNKNLEEKFGVGMKFDVVIGNPPYQLAQSGEDSVGGAALPVYQKFVDAAKAVEPRFISMVTPSRWFAGGRGLDEFRAEMLADRRLRGLVDYPNSTDVFPGTQIKGGVSYFLWDSAWAGDCTVTTYLDRKSPPSSMSRSLSAHDVLVRWNEAVPILEKVISASSIQGWGNLSSRVSPIRPFGLRTNFRGEKSPQGMQRPIRLVENGGQSFVEYAEIVKNHSWVEPWKVMLGRAYGAGDGFPHQIYNFPILVPPESACTETYLIAGMFSSELEAENYLGFLKTRFVRFLVSLRKNTQDIYNDRFKFVPDLPMNRTWSDEDVYDLFGITASEILFIEAMVRPMDGSDE